jgi:hypothetical protein
MWMEASNVPENNNPMNNAICKLNAKPLRRYRIYQKESEIERNKNWKFID